MARVAFSPEALEQLRRMIEDRAPVPDAYLRVKNSVALLRDFPRAGVPLEDELTGLQSILGPWRWMRIIYA